MSPNGNHPDRAFGSVTAATQAVRGMQIELAKSTVPRRLPIYLLLDCSESMAGAYIESVRHGVTVFRDEVVDFEPAASSVHIGIITFASRARLVTGPELVSIENFIPPDMEAKGTTHLGEALRLLIDCIRKQVRHMGDDEDQLADYRPLVFILTDGEPTDDNVWPGARSEVQGMVDRNELKVVTVGCGPHINPDNIRAIAIGDSYFMMDDSAKSFQKFFEWVSASVVAQSVHLSRIGADGTLVGAGRARIGPDLDNETFLYIGNGHT